MIAGFLMVILCLVSGRNLFIADVGGSIKVRVYQSFFALGELYRQQEGEESGISQEWIHNILPITEYTSLRQEERTITGPGRIREILLAEDNEESTKMLMESPAGREFVPRQEPVQTNPVQTNPVRTDPVQMTDPVQVTDPDQFIRDYFTVDQNTYLERGELDPQTLLNEDLSLPVGQWDKPQILIYHTHPGETFADSLPDDTGTSIVGAGQVLTDILMQDYGYQVIHYVGDLSRDSYSKKLPVIEQILKENPTIQVVIDLHRDEMPENTRLCVDLNGKSTARFMFFNGLSRTRKTGRIDYLYNENLHTNLAFSMQMERKAREYYPGITRKIYLKGYRYNMHLCPRSLLVELGAQNNTYEEAVNACYPLAHILHLVLTGQ